MEPFEPATDNYTFGGIMNSELIRNDFPILKTKVGGHQIVYFDNAATTQRPLPVVNAVLDYTTHEMGIRTEAHTSLRFLPRKPTTPRRRSSVTSSTPEVKRRSSTPEIPANP